MCGVDPGLSPWGNTKGEVGDVSDCVGTFGSSVPKGSCAMAMIDRVPHLLGYPIESDRYAHMRAAYRTYSYALHGVRHYVTTYVYYSTATSTIYLRAIPIAAVRLLSPLAGLASPPAGASALCAACRPSPAPRRPAQPRPRPGWCGREWLAEWCWSGVLPLCRSA